MARRKVTLLTIALIMAIAPLIVTGQLTDTIVIDDNFIELALLDMLTSHPGGGAIGLVASEGAVKFSRLSLINSGNVRLGYAMRMVTQEDVWADAVQVHIKTGVTDCTGPAGFDLDGTTIYTGHFGSVAGTDLIGNSQFGLDDDDRLITRGQTEVLCIETSMPIAPIEPFPGTRTKGTLFIAIEER